jgi:hypothetical protein
MASFRKDLSSVLFEGNSWSVGQNVDAKNMRIGDKIVDQGGAPNKKYVAIHGGYATIDGYENYGMVKLKLTSSKGDQEIILGLDSLEAIVKAFSSKDTVKQDTDKKPKEPDKTPTKKK